MLQHARESGIFAAKQALGKGNGSPYTYTPYFYSRVFDLGWEVSFLRSSPCTILRILSRMTSFPSEISQSCQSLLWWQMSDLT